MVMSKNYIYYIVIPIVACTVLFVLEQVVLVDYLTKTIAKLVMFLGIPLAVWFLIEGKRKNDNLKGELGSRLMPGIYVGLGVMCVLGISYAIFHTKIDSVSIMAELNEKSGITKKSYLFTGLYITLCNSFLEELFFRRYIFYSLYKANLKWLAYFGSALLFSAYHLAIFNTWFSPFILVLSLLGLIAAGLILNIFVAKTKSLLSSWVIHMCANIAIIAIGYTWL